MAVTIDLIANDIPGTFPLDPTSIALSNVDPTLNVTDNNDGTVDVEGDTIGQFTFDYTVADTNSNVSPAATVTVTIQATPVAPNSVAGLVQWFDASALPVVPDNTALATLTAVVGNDGVSGPTNPVYRTASLNGNPCVQFSGSANSRFDFADPFGASLSSYTIVFAAELTINSQQGVILSNRLGSGGGGAVIFTDTGSSQEISFFTYGTSNGATSTGLTVGTPVVIGLRKTPAGKDIFFDLTLAGSNTDLDVLTNNDWKLGGEPLVGGNWNFPGYLGELAMYGVALNDVDLLNVIQGLKQKYGI